MSKYWKIIIFLAESTGSLTFSHCFNWVNLLMKFGSSDFELLSYPEALEVNVSPSTDSLLIFINLPSTLPVGERQRNINVSQSQGSFLSKARLFKSPLTETRLEIFLALREWINWTFAAGVRHYAIGLIVRKRSVLRVARNRGCRSEDEDHNSLCLQSYLQSMVSTITCTLMAVVLYLSCSTSHSTAHP